MMLQGVPAKDLVEHCEKYLFLYEDGHFCVHTDALNNMEKALAFDYLFYKLHGQAVTAQAKFFNPSIFLAMISSLVYKLMKAEKDPLGMEAYETTINGALDKIQALQAWFESGEPPDDSNLINEMVEIMNANKERMAPMLDMVNQLIAMKQGGNGGKGKT